MPPRTPHPQRRADGLSAERIVDAAVTILDAEGEDGLTFRRLAERLVTGPGAIYHHVANKNELLVAATETVLTAATMGRGDDLSAKDAVRAIAVAVFDAIDHHPWVGAQLANPVQPAMLRIFELIGRQVRALGVPAAAEFTSVSALTNYILGVGGLNAANARVAPHDASRADLLATVATAWENLDAGEYPFTRDVAAQMREHDDRTQFLDGIDLILTGIGMLGHRRHDF